MSGGTHARPSRLRRGDRAGDEADVGTPAVGEPSDPELLAAVRAGDESAYDTLWRRHERAARNFARSLVRPSDADELVSEAFYRVLHALRQGGGPDGAFRTYLLRTIRHAHIDLGRGYLNRILLTDDPDALEIEHAPSAADEVLDQDESSAAWRAWASLPDDARTLLWHSIIEEESPAQIAPLLGISANGVASRTVRAREKLRQAFLDQHVQDADSQQCAYTRERLGRYTRNGLSERETGTVHDHLEQCARCKGAFTEITDLNFAMRAGIAPVVIGGAAAAKYLGGAHFAWLPWGRQSGSRGPAGVAAAVAVIVVAAAAALIVRQVADAPVGHQQAAADPASHAPVHVAPRQRSSVPPTRRAVKVTPIRATRPLTTAPRVASTHSVPASPIRTRPARSTPSPSPRSAAPTSSPALPSTVTKTVTMTLTGADGTPGQLTATTGQPWTITSIVGSGAASCGVRSAGEAACWLLLPTSSAQTFVVTVVGPSTGTGSLHATYDSLAAAPVSHDYPI